MKGVVLAGGYGTRLLPLTKTTNKHLLPVYNKPMIYYPIGTLMGAGITDILIVTGPENCGDFMKLLGSGKEFGAQFTYRIQDEAGGIAQALSLAKNFVGKEKCAVILGDNIFEDNFAKEAKEFEGGGDAMVFLKQVPDPERFGVAKVEGERVVEIVEKPKQHIGNYAVTGLYFYSAEAFEAIKTIKPSWRNELEITDVNNHFVKKGTMKHAFVKGYWSDAGTFHSLMRASKLVAGEDAE
jgi:glucose-1-phosphate thymidylyltransferase